MRFWKGHALGNDYIVLDPADGLPPEPAAVRALCDRHRGVGSDGVLVGDRSGEPVGLRIFNPDGTEAEKSGNGLRIFGAWLHRLGRVGAEPFRVALPGETVTMRVTGEAEAGSVVLEVEMGRASFRAGDAGYAGADPEAEVVGEPLELEAGTVAIHPVGTGNPHCVVLTERLDPAAFRSLAPAIQASPLFPRGVNVQFARVVGPNAIEALVWERGAGETEASGSSACAVAAAALRAGAIAGREITVRMPGGELLVEVDEAWNLRLTGPAMIVFEGEIPPPPHGPGPDPRSAPA